MVLLILLSPLIFVNAAPQLFMLCCSLGCCRRLYIIYSAYSCPFCYWSVIFAAVAEAVIYGQSLLTDLGFLPPAPTYSTKIMSLVSAFSTPRSKHTDTRWFRVQVRASRGDIVMPKIIRFINRSVRVTTPNRWVLHHRHARRIMGHCRDWFSIIFIPIQEDRWFLVFLFIFYFWDFRVPDPLLSVYMASHFSFP